MTERLDPDRVRVCTLVAWVVFLAACANPVGSDSETYLVRVGESTLSAADFKRAFEIAKTAYPHNEMQQPGVLNAMLGQLLNQSIEELVLLERARELGIHVGEAEIESHIAVIKRDYPAGAFDQMLLEHAVSMQMWKRRLTVRLIMERVVEEELKGRIALTEKEISAHYDAHYRSRPAAQENPREVNAAMVAQLRRKKAEGAYRTWMDNLRKRYPVELNPQQWNQICVVR